MPELRKDPITARWVIISSERAKRPNHRPHRQAKLTVDADNCPFCLGREQQTPPEIEAFREKGTKPDTPGWSVRVVPNKFPALNINEQFNKKEIGLTEFTQYQQRWQDTI